MRGSETGASLRRRTLGEGSRSRQRLRGRPLRWASCEVAWSLSFGDYVWVINFSDHVFRGVTRIPLIITSDSAPPPYSATSFIWWSSSILSPYKHNIGPQPSDSDAALNQSTYFGGPQYQQRRD